MAYAQRPHVLVVRPLPRRGTSTLGDLGIQIGPKLRLGGSVGKIAGNVQRTVAKAATDTGHAVGAVAKNPLVEGVTAGALALTGVGAPAAAAILAAERGGGTILAKHGTIGKAAVGAAEGAAAGLVVGNIRGIAKGGVGLVRGGASLVGKGVSSVTHGAERTVASIFKPSGTSPATPGMPPGALPAVGRTPGAPGTRGRGGATAGTPSDPTGQLAQILQQLQAAQGGAATPYAPAYSPAAAAPTVQEASMLPSGLSGFLSSPLGLAVLVGGGLLLVTHSGKSGARR